MFVSGIIFASDGLYCSENAQKRLDSMSYANMQEVSSQGLYILIKGKNKKKMWIKKHPLMIETDEFINLINIIIKIEKGIYQLENVSLNSLDHISPHIELNK